MGKIIIKKENSEIINEYILEKGKKLENIKRLIAKKDFNEIYKVANEIKGSSNKLGLKEISEMSKHIEEEAIDCNGDMVKIHIQKLLYYMDNLDIKYED